jgi:hypothetical protein
MALYTMGAGKMVIGMGMVGKRGLTVRDTRDRGKTMSQNWENFFIPMEVYIREISKPTSLMVVES